MDGDDVIVGIDLGTTNSLIGVVDSGFPILLADAEGARLLPSVVSFPESESGGEVLVGAPALRARALHPARTVTSVKRLMGRRAGEITGKEELGFAVAGEAGEPLRIAIPGLESRYAPEEISALILGRLKENAEKALGFSVSRAVITVPAYFNDAQRTATMRAGELAGFAVERILNEPTAAALAYGLDRLTEKSRVAVYDLGGGTFDISILELHEGVFQVIGTHGDTQLGGDDFDAALAASMEDGRWKMEDGVEAAAIGVRARLLEAAREAKEKLSVEEEVVVRLPFLVDGENLERTVTRGEFEKLIAPFLDRTRRHCLHVLADAGLEPGDLDEVILVGGSTRIPRVRTLVAEIFGREPNLSQHPDEAVALGATIQGGILSGALKEMVLLDVTPLSLGIETFGGLMNVIIARNTTIPAKAGEMFTNAVANQESMLIRVLQGEREMANDNWELGKFEIPFEKGQRGSARVGVQFAIDENGILEVLARDTVRNHDKVLKIVDAAVDVEDAKVESMISESVEHAFEDMNARKWTEARLKSEELLPAVKAGVAALRSKMKEGEVSRIEAAAHEVKAALENEPRDLRRLQEANDRLDEVTQGLAGLLVEKAMDEALEERP